MYIDFSIPVLDKLPKVVKEEIAFIEEMYNRYEKDETDVEALTLYMIRQDSVESYLKDCLMQRIINDEEFDLMFKRFGWYR